MDINATLLGQFITFAILVWFTMKYVWPPIMGAMHEREKKIIAGLEASDRSKRELEMAEHKAIATIREARQQASQIIEQANLHAAQLIEEAKQQGKVENQRIVEMAQGEIDREVTKAREVLKTQLAGLVVTGVEKIIKHNLDTAAHHDLLNELAAEI